MSNKKSRLTKRRRRSIIGFEMIRLDRAAAEPLHQQLYRQIRDELKSGSFDDGSSRLPSSRALAVDLGISRLTVNLAFSKLHAEGYIRSKTGSGTFVADSLPETFLNAPKLLDATFQLKTEPGLYFAGQITGTEGYVESAAGGLLCALFIAERLAGREPVLPPKTTAHGGLITHLSRDANGYQPSNITFSHLPPWDGKRLQKRAKYAAIAERALADLESWIATYFSAKPSSGAAPQIARP